MKELDLLKKDWQKEGQPFKQVSEEQINTMIHKKSSSIVKRILIISVVEFLFWIAISVLLTDDKYNAKVARYGLEDFMFISNIVNYGVLLFFIYFFYKNYKTISTTDSTRQLMKNILATRKTVKYYIWYNLGIVALDIVMTLIMEYYHDEKLLTLRQNTENSGMSAALLLVGLGIVILAIGIVAVWLFYRLLYGILLKKLYNNYNELKKTEQ
ncbi:hypothetical protein [Flavobacterium pallidum]|uniref:Beta-carotene 15,15'-monooxygenase n=1 Tax=Flavobacterium pallidum TaxID=2172098 RepID=A0A2S1SI62_9FLAO|nr:hypothetical protein [Flavobacterium pallidum]AWI26032.1 hypothetical protein HYN49_09060 [Flavobacterium pallidum]